MNKVQNIWRCNKEKLFSLSDQGIVSGTNFLVAILISKFGGLETYGEYAIIWLGFFLLHGLMTSFIGLPFLVLGNKAQCIHKYCTRNLQLLNVSLLLIWCACVIILFILHQFYPSVVVLSNYLLIPSAVIMFVKHEQHRRFLFAKGMNKTALLVDMIAYFLQVPCLVLIGVVWELSLESVFSILLTLGGLSNLVFHIVTSENKLFGPFRSLPLIENWRYAKFLIATNLIQFTSSNFLLLSLGLILGVSAVATVRLVQNLMGVLHVFFMTIENVVPAKASLLLHKYSSKHFKTYFKAVVKKSSIFFGLVLGMLWILKAEILSFIYGSEFVRNEDLFGWFIILYIFIFSGTLIQIYLKTTEANKAIFIAYIVSLIASFLTSNYLIETFDIFGYVYGLMLFQLIGIGIYLVSIKRMNYDQ
ncbi:MAG: O-antigen/teichoic acid export membrane protein [Arenicella sp.]|jgi:O-antigen/teichoic acid export membrane protein